MARALLRGRRYRNINRSRSLAALALFGVAF